MGCLRCPEWACIGCVCASWKKTKYRRFFMMWKSLWVNVHADTFMPRFHNLNLFFPELLFLCESGCLTILMLSLIHIAQFYRLIQHGNIWSCIIGHSCLNHSSLGAGSVLLGITVFTKVPSVWKRKEACWYLPKLPFLKATRPVLLTWND